MTVTLTKTFLKDVDGLDSKQKSALFDVILKLPKVLQNPLKHDGVGLRKIHVSGIFEARLGLSLRLVFGCRQNEIVLHRVGNHDDVRRYLKAL